MITNLSIRRFKSIKDLDLPCRKVNVFIGAPDTGKTNILEALYLLSRIGWGLPIDHNLRLRQELGFDALFYRQFFDQPFLVKLQLDTELPNFKASSASVTARIEGENRALQLRITPRNDARHLSFGGVLHFDEFSWIRFYAYSSSEAWHYRSDVPGGASVVSPPHGANLLYIARHNSSVYSFLKEMLSELDWKLRFDQNLKTFRLSEVRRDEILDYNLDHCCPN